MNKNYEYEYYLKLSRPDGESFNASILSQVNLRGLVFPWKWIVQGDEIFTNPTIEAVLVLKEPNPYDV